MYYSGPVSIYLLGLHTLKNACGDKNLFEHTYTNTYGSTFSSNNHLELNGATSWMKSHMTVMPALVENVSVAAKDSPTSAVAASFGNLFHPQ